jgi:hypothetical protein
MLELMSAIILSFGWIWFSVMTGILLILFISSDYSENGYLAAVSFAVYAGIVYFVGDVEWSNYFTMELLYQVLIYLGIGIGFSFIRTITEVFALKKDYDNYVKSYPSKKTQEDLDEKVERLKVEGKETISGSILRWVFIWV